MAPQDVVALAQRKFRPLQDVLAEDIILMAVIPDYPVTDEVEMSKELWPSVWKVVHTVTIALESGASAVRSDDDTTGSADIGVSLVAQKSRPQQSGLYQSCFDNQSTYQS